MRFCYKRLRAGYMVGTSVYVNRVRRVYEVYKDTGVIEGWYV